MKLTLPLVLSSSLLFLLLLSVVVVVDGSNITKGSSLSTSSPNTTYWLSPSGRIAFGFYPLCEHHNSSCSQFIVGIWFVKSDEKTLVWTANRNDPPLNHPSSILFNNEGKLVLQTSDVRERPLLVNMWDPATYAAMLDNGNFVLYGSNSSIIWESFDYPTDTILGGQTLKSGQSLISSSSKFDPSYGTYELWIKQSKRDNNLAICDMGWDTIYQDEVRKGHYDSYAPPPDCDLNRNKEVSPVSLKLDPTTGRLYTVNWDTNVVLINITEGDQIQPKQQQQHNGSNVVLYRATLDMDGFLRVYKEITIGGDSEISVLLWDSVIYGNSHWWYFIALIVIFVLFLCCCGVVTWFKGIKPSLQRRRDERIELARIRSNPF